MRRSAPARALESPARLITRLRRDPPAEQSVLLLLIAVSGGITLAGATWDSSIFPPAMLALPLLFGGLMLARRALRQLAVFVTLFLLFDVVELGWKAVRPGAMLVVIVTGLVAHEFSRSREETGLSGMRSDSVLLELK
ncbi:MAG: hypothetical protein JWM40_445 [Frankiales bacterium]|nr:hypothetical protein [Frankiales bacterium]